MNNNINHQPISIQGLLDLTLFFSIFWMILSHNVGHQRSEAQPKQGRARGRWRPNVMYLPVLLLRWVFVPHRDWTKEHEQYCDEDDVNHPHHHDPHHHHNPHHHHHHRHHHQHGQLNDADDQNIVHRKSSYINDEDVDNLMSS